MILVILTLATICFFVSYIYISEKNRRLILTSISGAILIGSIILISANFSNHYGMAKETLEKQKIIFPVNTIGTKKIILYKYVGTNSQKRVVIYATDKQSKNIKNTGIDEYTTNRIKYSKKDVAYIISKETTWSYKSNIYKLLFSISGNNHELIKKNNTVFLPNDWQTLSVKEGKTLKRKLQSQKFQIQMKKDISFNVQKELTERLEKNPSLKNDTVALKDLSKTLSTQIQQEYLDNLITETKKDN